MAYSTVSTTLNSRTSSRMAFGAPSICQTSLAVAAIPNAAATSNTLRFQPYSRSPTQSSGSQMTSKA